MGPVAVVDVIGGVVMIEAILPRVGGAPGSGRKGETSMIVGGGRIVGGRDGIGILVVADGLGVSGRLLVWIINYTGTVKELRLSSITSGIVGIRVGVGRRVEGVCGKGEIGLVRDSGGSSGGMVVDWSAAEAG
jgi:hypothetical protein